MQPTTIRLPAETLEALDIEYAEYGYGARSDYIRAIIEHRDPPFETAETTADYAHPTTDDYERLHDRVDELEARLESLEGRRGPVDRRPEPQGSGREDDVVEWARENQPVERADVIAALYPDDYPHSDDTWWRNEARELLKAAGFEYVRNQGWQK